MGREDVALLLGAVGTALGIVSAIFGVIWSIYTFFIQGARPKLQLVYGGVMGNHGPAAPRDIQELHVTVRELKRTRDELHADRLVAGLRVTNPGRAPLYVAGISWRTDPGGLRGHNAHLNFEGSPAMPCDIPAGGEATFYVELAVLNEQTVIAEKMFERPQRIAIEIWNAHREYRSETIPPEILAIEPPRRLY